MAKAAAIIAVGYVKISAEFLAGKVRAGLADMNVLLCGSMLCVADG